MQRIDADEPRRPRDAVPHRCFNDGSHLAVAGIVMQTMAIGRRGNEVNPKTHGPRYRRLKAMLAKWVFQCMLAGDGNIVDSSIVRYHA